jgi:methionyl-tRNA formyltransferase
LTVVTRPIDDPGKRRKTSVNPVREYAVAHGLPIIEPASCNSAETVEQLQQLSADLFFVCDYGQLLSRRCLQAARLGGINLHGSLLPRYRGAAPINWAIYHGETETGVTVIHMTPRMDAGPCLTTARLAIAEDDTAEMVEQRLSKLGVSAVTDAIDLLDQWDGETTIGAPQDPALASRAPRLEKTDGKIDWSRTARQIVNQIRAFKPWPSTYCQWSNNRQAQRLIIHEADVMKIETDAPAGVVVAVQPNLLAIQTGEHALSIRTIQPAGRKAMPIADFLRGHRIAVGQQME